MCLRLPVHVLRTATCCAISRTAILSNCDFVSFYVVLAMGKHGKYKRKFKPEWIKESWAKGWLREYSKMASYDAEDQNEAYCVYCRTSLRAHYTDLQKHCATKIHRNHAENKIAQKKDTVKRYFSTTSLSAAQKVMDLKLTMYILSHSSIRSVDHLSDLLVKEGVNTGEAHIFANIRLHRTKCSAIIKRILGKACLEEIVKNIGNQKYSCIVDESTDVSVNKYLAVCLRYFDDSRMKIVTDFLGLIELSRSTSIDLYISLKDFFNKIGLPIVNMIALGTDGGANLCGKHNSLYTLLKNDIPDLILIKCVCHTIHLCVSKASRELPSCLDYLCQEVYGWFSNSALRKMQYRNIFELININEEKTFKNIIKLSATRWLSRYNVIKRLLENWLELKTFFSIVGIEEKCYKARTISNILNDDKMLSYFKFLLPVLEDTYRLNLIFQSNDYDIGSAYKQYFLTVQSLAKRIMKPMFLNISNIENLNNSDCEILVLNNIVKEYTNASAYLRLDNVDLGYMFCKFLDQMKANEEEILEIKTNCHIFLNALLKEFVERLPSNISMFAKIELINPNVCLNKEIDTSMSCLALHYFMFDTDGCAVENQWRKLKLVDWKNNEAEALSNNNVLKFWPAVYNYADGAGNKPFKELALTVLRLLTLPMSNAAVERAFSVMNHVKTKYRNKMKLDTLQAIIRIKIYGFNRDICCKNFEPSSRMLELFNTTIYENDDTNELEIEDIADAVAILNCQN